MIKTDDKDYLQYMIDEYEKDIKALTTVMAEIKNEPDKYLIYSEDLEFKKNEVLKMRELLAKLKTVYVQNKEVT